MFLSGLGWIAAQPAGNRLRWTIDPEEITPGGRFRGLPDVVTLERAPLKAPVKDVPTVPVPVPLPFPVPPSWWQVLGNLPVGGAFPARLVLPGPVQALRCVYAGPSAFLRVRGRSGSERPLLEERPIHNGDPIAVDASFIEEVEIFGPAATLQQVTVLDLFADHAAGLPFEVIARVSPRGTMTMSFEAAYQRYGAAPTLDLDEWMELQTVSMPSADASAPGGATSEPSPWQEVQLLLAARWEYAVVYGLGFLDGPGAGPGAPGDQISSSKLLSGMGSVPHVYRATAEYADGSVERSNLIVIPASPAAALPIPTNLGYTRPEVRLYGEDTYTVTSTLGWSAGSRHAIGAAIEEEVGASPILGSAPEVIPFTFRSPAPAAVFPVATVPRRFDVRFHDVPLRFRARSIDGWDRSSGWSPWSAAVQPVFVHNPAGPPLQEARFDGAQITLRAQTAHLSFTEWSPDHAVAHTPGSRLEVLRRVEEPDHATVQLEAPAFHAEALDRQVRLYSVPVPPLPDPGKYVGGSLAAGTFRTEILRMELGRYIFESAADSMHGSAWFEAGPATLQQATNHPDLFVPVTDFSATSLPHVLELPDALAPAIERARVEHYAVRVRIGALAGAIGNTVQSLVIPEPPRAPPPFSIELLGVDFYDRTLVRVSFVQPLTGGTYTLFWAAGSLDEDSFDKAAIAGDLGSQEPQGGHHLYELFSLPIPRTQGAPVTFGAQRETGGAYRSSFTLVHAVVSAYAAEP
jgi:hypothetical protein